MDVVDIATLLIALFALGVSIWSILVSKKADRRTAAYADAAFKIADLRTNDQAMRVTLENVGKSTAFKVHCDFIDPFSEQPPMPFLNQVTKQHSEVVEPGTQVQQFTPGGTFWWGGLSAAGYAKLRVSWTTASGEHREMVLGLPNIRHDDGHSFRD